MNMAVDHGHGWTDASKQIPFYYMHTLHNNWLVVLTILKNMNVNGKDDIPYTSSTAQGGGGSFKNRKPIGEVGCCESGMAEPSH